MNITSPAFKGVIIVPDKDIAIKTPELYDANQIAKRGDNKYFVFTSEQKDEEKLAANKLVDRGRNFVHVASGDKNELADYKEINLFTDTAKYLDYLA